MYNIFRSKRVFYRDTLGCVHLYAHSSISSACVRDITAPGLWNECVIGKKNFFVQLEIYFMQSLTRFAFLCNFAVGELKSN